MELSSIVGPVLGAVAVLGTAVVKGISIPSLFGVSAVMIIGLGSAGAVVTAYPMKDVVHSMKSLGLFISGPKANHEELIAEIERLSQMHKKDGSLALEKEIEGIQEPILKKGIQMIVDNIDGEVIHEALENEIEILFEEEEIAAKFWEDMGAFSPTVGIIGAVLGLMVVMNNLDNPDAIGPGIATAFIATIYGVALANLFALPAGKKIKRMCQQVKLYREMALVGVMGISHGLGAKVIVERLNGMSEA